MSSEPASRPITPQGKNQKPTPQTVNPQDLVYAGGSIGNAREIVENPAVTPQMLNESGDLRSERWQKIRTAANLSLSDLPRSEDECMVDRN
jgi:hypothetical protein